jgi:BA14K-like protein
MMLIKRASAAALVAATFAFGASALTMSANAGPAATAAAATTQATDTGLTTVRDRYYGGRRGHHYRGHGDGWNPGAAIGLGIAGAVIAGALDDEDGYDEGPAYYGDSGVQRCAAQFRSFEPDTGMYTTYGGERRMCPYLG